MSLMRSKVTHLARRDIGVHTVPLAPSNIRFSKNKTSPRLRWAYFDLLLWIPQMVKSVEFAHGYDHFSALDFSSTRGRLPTTEQSVVGSISSRALLGVVVLRVSRVVVWLSMFPVPGTCWILKMSKKRCIFAPALTNKKISDWLCLQFELGP